MKKIKLFFGVVLIFVLLAATFTTADAQEKYALLISGGQATLDDQKINSEYWYDLFLMYRMLIDKGFTHDHIFVLYGEGADFNSIHPEYQTATFFPGQITDYPNHKSNVQDIFTWLATGNVAEGIPQIQQGDFLFYWWMGHGSDEPCPDYHADIQNTGETIRDDEFATYFAQLPACVVKTLFVMTCHSGGLIDDFIESPATTALHTMIHTAADCTEGADSDMFDVWHAEFSYYVACAFWEQEPDGTPVASDTNGDTLVSVEETNVYAHTETSMSTSQIGDYRNIAPLIYIANAQPDAGVPKQGVYSRDYAEDNGSEPSDYLSYIWFLGPDLWVRHLPDGLTENQNPEFGQPNYVYARIHNIGCDLLNGVTAQLSWCDQSAWSNPALWNPIATVPINNFLSGESRVISTVWNTVPGPGKYCLHTLLNAPGDPASGDGRAYMDNNKVQINVDVEDAFWGWSKNFHWLIENALDKNIAVDVVLDKLDVPFSAGLTLKIPSNLEFERLIGGNFTQSDDEKIIKISPKVRKVVLKGVKLLPLDKKEAVLSVVIPKEIKLGENIIVKVSEVVKGKEMGGIVFKARAATQRVVVTTLFNRMANLFKVLDKRFKVQGFKEVFEFCRSAVSDCRLSTPDRLKVTMSEVIDLEFKIGEDMKKLMGEKEFIKFENALKASKLAFEKDNIGLFAESQEELIFSTKSLFLKK